MSSDTAAAEKETWVHPMITHLCKLEQDQDLGALAEIRRGATAWPKCPPMTIRHVVRFFPKEDESIGDGRRKSKEDALLLVATLFALHPSATAAGPDMGGVMKAIVTESSKDSVERRFLALLGAKEPEEIATHLRHAISLAEAKGVNVGWQRLLADVETLLGEDDDKTRDVRNNWSRSFWSAKSDRSDES